MSIQIDKVIQVYDFCLNLLQAKQNLYIENSELNASYQRLNQKSIQQKNISMQFIQDGILKIIRTWLKKFHTYEAFAGYHKHSYAQLQFKVDGLKNNSQLLSRQDQILAQIQTKIRQWKQNMNPVEYYGNKNRRTLKEQTFQKLQLLKGYQNKPPNITAPIYTKKIQSELQENIIATYYQQSKIDEDLITATIQIHNQLADILAYLDSQVNKNPFPNQLSLQRTSFIRAVDYILSKKSRPSDQRFRSYHQMLLECTNRNQIYWFTLTKNIQNLVQLLDQLLRSLAKLKSNFDQKQQKVNKILNDIPKTISKLFRIDVIQILIKSFRTINGASIIVKVLRDKIASKRQWSIRMQDQCKQYLTKANFQASRYQNYHHCAMVDRRFFQQQSKAQRAIIKYLISLFKQFLQHCYNLTKDVRRNFNNQSIFQIYDRQYLKPYLSKLIISDNDDLSAILSKNNQLSKLKLKKVQSSYKVAMQQKIAKIQQFLNNTNTFNSSSITQTQKYYSCALGPKLLLHGKLYILQQGIFFESHFNKKNLLFGKTKIFIPKSQIIQIDMKNTLLVFPDAVIIKTQHGLVSFHALGQRKAIGAAMKQVYLGIGKGSQIGDEAEGGVQEVADFRPFDEAKKQPQTVIQKICHPLETPIAQAILKGSNVQKVFRKYFGNDSFQINGQKYSCFKTYCLSLIDAKNPQSTSIQPAPPIYFMYQSETVSQNHYPTTSTRSHTYQKALPKIPFLSKGGDGQCQQKQTFTWLGPNLFVIDILSTVKGFSLTEGMQIFIKYVVKSVNEGVRISVTCQVKFAKESSSNGLVKNPTISNLKQSITKIVNTIQKLQKTRKVGAKPGESTNTLAPSQQVDDGPKDSGSTNQLQISRKQLQYIAIGFTLFYILSLIIIKAF